MSNKREIVDEFKVLWIINPHGLILREGNRLYRPQVSKAAYLMGYSSTQSNYCDRDIVRVQQRFRAKLRLPFCTIKGARGPEIWYDHGQFDQPTQFTVYNCGNQTLMQALHNPGPVDPNMQYSADCWDIP